MRQLHRTSQNLAIHSLDARFPATQQREFSRPTLFAITPHSPTLEIGLQQIATPLFPRQLLLNRITSEDSSKRRQVQAHASLGKSVALLQNTPLRGAERERTRKWPSWRPIRRPDLFSESRFLYMNHRRDSTQMENTKKTSGAKEHLRFPHLHRDEYMELQCPRFESILNEEIGHHLQRGR